MNPTDYDGQPVAARALGADAVADGPWALTRSDAPANVRQVGVLTANYVEELGYWQYLVNGVPVDPATIAPVDMADHAEFRYDPFQPRHPAGTTEGGRWAPSTTPSTWRWGRDGGVLDRIGRRIMGDDYDRPPGGPIRLSPAPPDPRAAARRARRNTRYADYVRAGNRVLPTREDLDRPHAALYGKGYTGVEGGDPSVLFKESLITPVPFPSARRLKGEQLYDRDLVAEVLSSPFALTRIDPRSLRASQPNVTREGVTYYMGNEYRHTGRTFADQDQSGNRFPVVYRQPRTGENVILSGHHRAVADLLLGRDVEAVYIDPTRNQPIVLGPGAPNPNPDWQRQPRPAD